MSVVKKVGSVFVSSVCLSLCLTACSSHYASNAETNYLNSRNGPDLVVPPSLTKSNLGYFYSLPPQNQDARVSIKPPVA